jgi:hypothetical protein
VSKSFLRKDITRLLQIPVKIDILIRNRELELVRPVPQVNLIPRNYKSMCIICFSINYSYNSDRKYLCHSCVRIVYCRDVFSFFVARRKKRKYKKMVFAMKRLIDSNPIEGVFGEENEWANTMTWFFKTMSWDVKDHMLSFLFKKK